jgi:hypothetical protein
LACYVVAPARKARTGRIGLRVADGDGFGTPPLGDPDGTRIVVRGDRVVREPSGASVGITTLRAAAAFVGVELTADPGVGRDLPPFEPDAPLEVDAGSSFELGRWYAFGSRALDALAAGGVTVVGEQQLWPEHFDLAMTVHDARGAPVNVGFSPGDGFCDEPYVYVGPHDTTHLTGPLWNAPFGAYRTRHDLQDVEGALAFVRLRLDADR